MNVSDIAQKHGFSRPAAQAALDALRAGAGAAAQFSHPELGGSGQWMPGMIMIGDMFNSALKSRVASLFDDLARGVRDEPPDSTPGAGESHHSSGRFSWYPQGLGNPASVGEQNGARYAYFPDSRRLAIQSGNETQLYDTGDHRIFGASQQQNSTRGSLRFQSQHGDVDLDSLRKVDA